MIFTILSESKYVKHALKCKSSFYISFDTINTLKKNVYRFDCNSTAIEF